MEATLKFYDDMKKVFIPENFETFLTNLADMLEIPQDFLNKLELFYKDKEEDKIMIQTSSDYIQFLSQLQKKEVSVIEIELDNKNNELKEKLSESFVKYLSNDNIINNNNIEIKHEIQNNNDNNDNNDNNNNNNNVKPVINNMGKDNIQKKNDELNNEIKPQLVQPHSIIENNKNVNQVMNNPNDIIMDNNNTNNQINLNLYNINENNIQKSNNYDNQNIQKNNNNKENNKIKFDVACISCSTKPVYTKIYKCQECNMYFCKKCEKKYGPIHVHALLKIRTNEQFKNLNNNNNLEEDSKISKVFDEVKGQVIDGFKKVNNNFSNNNNNNHQNNGIQNIIPDNQNYSYKNNYPYPPNQNQNNNIPYYHHNNSNRNPNQMQFQQNINSHNNNKIKKIIDLARKSYDLQNINDQELIFALRKANYNIEKAVVMLFNDSK